MRKRAILAAIGLLVLIVQLTSGDAQQPSSEASMSTDPEPSIVNVTTDASRAEQTARTEPPTDASRAEQTARTEPPTGSDPDAADSAKVTESGPKTKKTKTRTETRTEPKAEKETEPTHGALVIDSEPRGASVKVYDQKSNALVFQDKSPSTVNLPVGKYRVLIERSGYLSKDTIVVVKANRLANYVILLGRPKTKSSDKPTRKKPPRKRTRGDNNMAPSF